MGEAADFIQEPKKELLFLLLPCCQRKNLPGITNQTYPFCSYIRAVKKAKKIFKNEFLSARKCLFFLNPTGKKKKMQPWPSTEQKQCPGGQQKGGTSAQKSGTIFHVLLKDLTVLSDTSMVTMTQGWLQNPNHSNIHTWLKLGAAAQGSSDIKRMELGFFCWLECPAFFFCCCCSCLLLLLLHEVMC